MSLQEECWQESIPTETARIGQIILKEQNQYRLIGDHVSEILTLADFAHLYSEDGRGAVCPLILSLVTLFQFLEDLPDREAAEAVVVRLDWKYALHVAVEWQGFHYSTLCNYRKRLMVHGEERLLFEKVLQWVMKRGFVKKKSKQRSDSTHVLGKVARLSRLELLWETLRMTLKALTRRAPYWYGKTIPAAFDEAYRERRHDWRLSEKEIKQATMRAGEDGFWLLDRVAESGEEALDELPEVETLRVVWEQNFTRGEDEGERGGGRKVQLREREKVPSKERISSPHEQEARWAEKRGSGWLGYKFQVTESVADDGRSGFLTDVRITAAPVHDSQVTMEIQDQLLAQGLVPDEQIVDQGYMSGANMAASQRRGINLLGPLPADTSGKTNGYQLRDFHIDWQNQVVTCPQGQCSVLWRPQVEKNKKMRTYVRFSSSTCRACSAWGVCTSSAQGRSLSFDEYQPMIAARRAEQKTEDFRERYKARAAIEGTISVLVRKHGVRRARYRGDNKVNLQAQLTGAAWNIKQAARELTRQNKLETRKGTNY